MASPAFADESVYRWMIRFMTRCSATSKNRTGRYCIMWTIRLNSGAGTGCRIGRKPWVTGSFTETAPIRIKMWSNRKSSRLLKTSPARFILPHFFFIAMTLRTGLPLSWTLSKPAVDITPAGNVGKLRDHYKAGGLFPLLSDRSSLVPIPFRRTGGKLS